MFYLLYPGILQRNYLNTDKQRIVLIDKNRGMHLGRGQGKALVTTVCSEYSKV